MPTASKIQQLPEDVLSELNQRLVGSGFGGYVELSEWLEEQGFEVSKSAIGRHSQKIKRRLNAIQTATESAKILSENVADDEGAMNDAVLRMIQERVFTALVDMEDVEVSDIGSLAKLGKVIAPLVNASIKQKEYQVKVREKAELAAKSVADTARSGGLSEETVRMIESQILGITR